MQRRLLFCSIIWSDDIAIFLESHSVVKMFSLGSFPLYCSTRPLFLHDLEWERSSCLLRSSRWYHNFLLQFCRARWLIHYWHPLLRLHPTSLFSMTPNSQGRWINRDNNHRWEKYRARLTRYWEGLCSHLLLLATNERFQLVPRPQSCQDILLALLRLHSASLWHGWTVSKAVQRSSLSFWILYKIEFIIIEKILI